MWPLLTIFKSNLLGGAHKDKLSEFGYIHPRNVMTGQRLGITTDQIHTLYVTLSIPRKKDVMNRSTTKHRHTKI